jgi:hypothetical protein
VESVLADDEAVAAFVRDGVVCLRSVLDGEQVAAVARHAPRAWRTSPPFDGLDAELPAGAPMDHPLFPVVWPA